MGLPTVERRRRTAYESPAEGETGSSPPRTTRDPRTNDGKRQNPAFLLSAATSSLLLAPLDCQEEAAAALFSREPQLQRKEAVREEGAAVAEANKNRVLRAAASMTARMSSMRLHPALGAWRPTWLEG
jgi:hypothetical protein